ncbi:dol-P-Man:Man(7)GlcNAc(2)-PP-Dol alpha-1,6-mannosyltransferase-like [Ananas comosus]|uniref:Mannosyltransferase n=1 Tax=Ananas comosus TaxID=4615 RepID=A0A6P5G309_ANACO|nr:dol-P-Man:Man(7)GlcNAc(2)-PP-Dol alpha-1,6-mannosyltransferase-like [Ananas comosus]
MYDIVDIAAESDEKYEVALRTLRDLKTKLENTLSSKRSNDIEYSPIAATPSNGASNDRSNDQRVLSPPPVRSKGCLPNKIKESMADKVVRRLKMKGNKQQVGQHCWDRLYNGECSIYNRISSSHSASSQQSVHLQSPTINNSSASDLPYRIDVQSSPAIIVTTTWGPKNISTSVDPIMYPHRVDKSPQSTNQNPSSYSVEWNSYRDTDNLLNRAVKVTIAGNEIDNDCSQSAVAAENALRMVVPVLLWLYQNVVQSFAFSVRLALGFIVLLTLRLFRLQVKRKFGYRVEPFFGIMTALQFYLLFYSTRPLPNILAFCLVNLAYSFWFKGDSLATLKCLTVPTVVFRCDTVLLFGPIGIELLLSKSVSLLEAIKCCVITALLCIGISVLVDSIMWQRILWPELEVFWFNSVLNRSSEWGTHPLHCYFTSALPRSMLVGYPLCMIGMILDRRIRRYVLPVFLFIWIFSKLPHKELRFILGSIPILNVSASIAASSVYNNRKKKIWSWIYVIMLGSFIVSVGCSIVTFMASYNNYPGGYALKALHQADASTKEKLVHIDAFTAMNGVSRFSENEYPWRYSKEGLAIEHFRNKNFTYLLNRKSQKYSYMGT